jgi:hypothetical protein
MRTSVKSPAQFADVAASPFVKIDDELWWVCPVDGPDCCRVNMSTLGTETSQDAISVHIWLHHQWWR